MWVRAQAAAQSHFWADASTMGGDFSRTGTAEGMPNHRRAPDAGPCAYVHGDSAQAPSGLCHRGSEGQERNCDRPIVREGTKLYRGTPMGARLCRVHDGI